MVLLPPSEHGYGYGSASRDYPLIRRSFTFSYSCTAPAAPIFYCSLAARIPSCDVSRHTPNPNLSLLDLVHLSFHIPRSRRF